MTKRQQRLIDDLNLAENEEDQLSAIKDALAEIDSSHLPLIALLVQQEDDSLDDLLIKEYLRDAMKNKC